MNRRSNSIAWMFLSSLTLAAGTGCQEETSSQNPATSRRATPEESFEEISKLVKEGIEVRGGAMSGFGAQDAKTSSRFQVNNTVTSRIIPPIDPAGMYRGTITVTSHSIYSLRRAAEEEQRQADAEREQGFSILEETEETGSGFESMDESLVSEPPQDDAISPGGAEVVQRRADEDVRTYDLAYENNRWVLKSELDLQTEKSIQNAIDRALSRQP